jgi:hypothetical protein
LPAWHEASTVVPARHPHAGLLASLVGAQRSSMRGEQRWHGQCSTGGRSTPVRAPTPPPVRPPTQPSPPPRLPVRRSISSVGAPLGSQLGGWGRAGWVPSLLGLASRACLSMRCRSGSAFVVARPWGRGLGTGGRWGALGRFVPPTHPPPSLSTRRPSRRADQKVSNIWMQRATDVPQCRTFAVSGWWRAKPHTAVRLGTHAPLGHPPSRLLALLPLAPIHARSPPFTCTCTSHSSPACTCVRARQPWMRIRTPNMRRTCERRMWARLSSRSPLPPFHPTRASCAPGVLLRFGLVIRVELPRALPPPRPRHIVITVEHRERYRSKKTPKGYYSSGHSLLPCKTAHTSRLRPIPHLRAPAAINSPPSAMSHPPHTHPPPSPHTCTRAAHMRACERATHAHTHHPLNCLRSHTRTSKSKTQTNAHEPIVDHFCGLLPAAWAYWATPATVGFLTHLKRTARARAHVNTHTHAPLAQLCCAWPAGPRPRPLASSPNYMRMHVHTQTHTHARAHTNTHTLKRGSALAARPLCGRARWRAPRARARGPPARAGGPPCFCFYFCCCCCHRATGPGVPEAGGPVGDADTRGTLGPQAVAAGRQRML